METDHRAGEGWPRLAERDLPSLRLAVCRELIGALGEERGTGGDFGDVGRFLADWDEARVRDDPAGFCREGVRLISLMLAHVDRATVDAPALVIG